MKFSLEKLKDPDIAKDLEVKIGGRIAPHIFADTNADNLNNQLNGRFIAHCQCNGGSGKSRDMKNN